MTLVVIFGPPAVGKMAVGMALARRTGLRLFHNHMTIDPVLGFFEFGTPPFMRLVQEFRQRIFEEVAGSELPGLIFTYVWALNDPRDRIYIDRLTSIFAERGAEVCYAELEASQHERLRRNQTPLRLEHKPSKRDLERSRANLISLDAQYQLNTQSDFPYPGQHLKIDNDLLAAEDAAARIAAHFGLTSASDVARGSA